LQAAVAYGFGGNAGIGSVQAGFDIAEWKCGPEGFGRWAVERNRDLLPGDWEAQSSDPSEWTPAERVGLLIGTPPCAAFSSMNFGRRTSTRGIDSPWNDCMSAFVEYAARSTGEDGEQGPEVIAFESVPAAFTTGMDLMRRLHDRIRRVGEYELTHLRITNAAIGSAQLRKRYWWVASRIGTPTFAEPTGQVVTAHQRIGDIENLTADVTDHESIRKTCKAPVCGCPSYMWPFTREGEVTKMALLRYADEHGGPPPGDSWARVYDRATGVRGTWIGWPKRLRKHTPAFTLTGYCITETLHYSRRRHITAREGLRLMGMPDEWSLEPASYNQAQAVIGKAAPVESCKYVADAAAALLTGRRTVGLQGEETRPAERVLRVDLPEEVRRAIRFNDGSGLRALNSR